jgi:hypothetical protein
MTLPTSASAFPFLEFQIRPALVGKHGFIVPREQVAWAIINREGMNAESARMSHHFHTPTAQGRSRINVRDFYLFRGQPGFTVTAMTVNPDAGRSASDTFRDEGLYAFRFDLNQWRRSGGIVVPREFGAVL